MSIEELPLGFEVSYLSTDASLPLRCTVTARADDSPEARFALVRAPTTARSRSMRRSGFPCCAACNSARRRILQCFFPQYRNALGAERATYYAYAGVAFPMQFFDVFDERTGGGVWLRTEDLADRQRNYFLSKQGDGASLYVEYPGLTTRLAHPARPPRFPSRRSAFTPETGGPPWTATANGSRPGIGP